MRYLAFLLIFFVACSPESEMTIIEEEDIDLYIPTLVECDLLIFGDGDGRETVRYKATINEVDYYSDENGVLFLNNILLNDLGNKILLEAEGYHTEVRLVIPKVNSKNYVYLEFQKLRNEISINGGSGGLVELNKVSIDFPAASFMDAQGFDYNGQVTLYPRVILDGLYASKIGSLPFNLIYDEAEVTALDIYGGLQIQAYDATGNRVYFKPGVSATLIYDANSILHDVPQELHIYALNEGQLSYMDFGAISGADGIFTTEINQVNHIVLADPNPAIFVEFDFKRTDGISIQNDYFMVYHNSANPFYLGYSDFEGKARAFVPRDHEFDMNTFKICANPIIRKDYDMVMDDGNVPVQIPSFIIDANMTANIYGEVVDCDDALVPDALVKLERGSATSYTFTDDDGGFNLTFQHCINEIGVSGYEPTLGWSSDKIDAPVTASSLTSIEVSPLVVCN